jgi:flavin-dependent dehydrogenase
MNALHSTSPVVAVLGGGPAGVATAVGLVRLGYAVTVFATPRRFDAMEGVSDRVAQGLHQAGLDEALATLASPSPRRVLWRGKESAVNSECLVSRPAFDAALLRDAARHGVGLCAARVESWQAGADGRPTVAYVTETGAVSFAADFVVEARGRAAPLPACRVRGPETVSLLQYWKPLAPGEARVHSAVQSFADGWAWLAIAADGRRYLQLTVDVASADLPEKSALSDFCRDRLERLEFAREFVADAEPEGPLYARNCTPILASDIVGAHHIRVGDAAVAGDPLSGNGIFLALSAALQAPAVIDTLLRHPERAALAREFHEQRLAGLFYRFGRVGRDFYADENQWPDAPFWKTRRAWPDAEPLHRAVRPEDVRIATRPVLRDDEIVAAEVVVTPDQPLGVWRLDGIDLAPALEIAREAGAAGLAAHLGSEELAAKWMGWFGEQGWIWYGE